MDRNVSPRVVRPTSRDKWMAPTTLAIVGIAVISLIIGLAGTYLVPNRDAVSVGLLIIFLAAAAWIAAFLVIAAVIGMRWWERTGGGSDSCPPSW